jgi:hypothetical protein
VASLISYTEARLLKRITVLLLFKQARWALARLIFIGYLVFSVLTVVGGFLTAPLMTWYFFGDWRFWRHWSAGIGLLPHALRLVRLMFTDNRAFMFSVKLTSPPHSSPDPSVASLNRRWPHGKSCGDCSNCCRPGGHVCPLLDETAGLCRGYNSFFWRYFNCGRFPSVEAEIEYYDCRKWLVAPVRAGGMEPEPALRMPTARLERALVFRPAARGHGDQSGDSVASDPPAPIRSEEKLARKA